MRNTGLTILVFLSTALVSIVTLVSCSPTSDSSSSSSSTSSSLTGNWERSCYSANYDEVDGFWGSPVKIYGKQEVIITSETLTSTTTGFTDANCSTEIGTVVVTGKYLLGDDVEVYPVKEAEVFDLAKVSAKRAGLYQMNVSITPKTSDAVQYLKGTNPNEPFYGRTYSPLESCQYEGWNLNQQKDVTSCHDFGSYYEGTYFPSSDYRVTEDRKAFAVFQVSGNQLLFEVKNDAYPTYFGLNSFTRK